MSDENEKVTGDTTYTLEVIHDTEVGWMKLAVHKLDEEGRIIQSIVIMGVNHNALAQDPALEDIVADVCVKHLERVIEKNSGVKPIINDGRKGTVVH